MGRWQPYLYNAPQSVDDFNPKAVTMASRQPPSPTKKKPDGPLVNFNRHPDSYFVLPYGKSDVKPMGPKVKTIIKVVRWIQLALRLCNLLGAVGVLLCAIFIKGAQTTEGYIMRIPPGADIVVALYAIYHLLRNAKSRPPASSASYHFFALITDSGFIPFYVFTALLSKRNLNEEAGTEGRWRTFFPTDEETDKVLQTAWLTATTVAGLHIASLFLDLYLVLIFRKIARLPPDMNPLEENLTSRRKTKHKYKDSSMSATVPLTQEEKRLSAQSSNMTLDNRNSQADPLIAGRDMPSPDHKAMSFMRTRTNSEMAYSPHTPNSARQSRERFSMYSQPASNRQSRIDLNHRDDLHRRDEDDDNETLAQRKSFLAQQAIKRNSRPNSFVTSSSKQGFYTPPTTGHKHESSGDISLQNSRETLQSDNWFVHGDLEEPEEKHNPAPKASMFTPKKQGYNTVATYDDVSDEEYDTPMMPQPLRMNPPTPPPGQVHQKPKNTPPPSKLQRTHTTTSMSSEKTFSRSPTRGSVKTRYYGDLKAATQGIRGNSPANSPNASPTKSGFAPGPLPSSAKQYTTNSPSAPKIKDVPFSLDKKSFASVRKTGETGYMPVKAQSPRVVSRSGVDYGFDDSDLGTPGRRRDVSGKIAEEGRGGGVGRWGLKDHGLTYRNVSGVA
ncbi:hypothetical protein K458DRAFT_367429 [Lentithecium fluviatile CBS 122367]|uniref:Uncharacterized protein n=1 Tax=Lentithecium fluviatile CBS 122367 TaxID=1168545 RepID=A0A6G1J0J6_9PLEO|nr:hypothetical protein K458DRAFT_367429 [Lentithecium fluviatile CBS 122367]